MLSIRPATPADIPAITRIYGNSVAAGTASFEMAPPTEADMAARMKTVLDAGYPYLAADVDSAFAGYTYAGAYRTRPAYRFTVENSVYVAPSAQRLGVGHALLMALIAECGQRGFRQMMAVIGDSKNQAGSVALHASAGFRVVGRLEDVGFKQERWLDTLLMQRALGDGGNSPPENP